MSIVNEYPEFLKTKNFYVDSIGFDAKNLNSNLFDWQKPVTAWTIRKGMSLLAADTGLGKTPMQAEWGYQYIRKTNKPTLIVSPLSVARQTIRQSKKILGYDITYSRGEKVNSDFVITNYEMLKNFNQDDWGQIIFDESSIFKAIDGATYRLVVEKFSKIKYKLCCTATAAPNDLDEFGNHCEVLGIMTSAEMKSTFFQNTGDTAEKWRMRPHGAEKFYEFLASWCMSLKKPSDIGFPDDGYNLPKLHIHPIFLDSDWKPEGYLINAGNLRGIGERNQVRRDTVDIRLKEVLRIAEQHADKQIICWNWLNPEADKVAAALGEQTRNIKGSDSPEYKAEMFEAFQDGQFRVLTTKPKIAAFGMNFQNAPIQIFNGIDDSWEKFYQCRNRSYRFGQKEEVHIYVVMVEAQRPIWENIERKQRQADEMSAELIKHVKDFEKEELTGKAKGRYSYMTKTEKGKDWTAMLGDSCEIIQTLKKESVHLSVFSPPFEDLFTYTATERDLGNSRNKEEFFNHFKYIIKGLFAVTIPGRNACVHVADIPLQKQKVGYMGMDDFPGDVIRAFQREGWIWYGRAFIQKNPQAQAIRTKAHALMFKTLRSDSMMSRPAIADQILVFKKPGKNSLPVLPVDSGEINNEKWIEQAHGVWVIDTETQEEIQIGMFGYWHGIHESDTLKYRDARGEDDCKHICPLQLGTISRCIKLYSNRGEIVFDPFGGIGSTGHEAIKLGRRAILCELKDLYFNQMVKNLRNAEASKNELDLFGGDYSNGNGELMAESDEIER